MSVRAAKAEAFRSLHVRGRPLVLFNIWDAGTAKAVASGGAQALATGSWSVAAANGFADGEHVPLDFAIDNLARIAAVRWRLRAPVKGSFLPGSKSATANRVTGSQNDGRWR